MKAQNGYCSQHHCINVYDNCQVYANMIISRTSCNRFTTYFGYSLSNEITFQFNT